MKLIGVTNWAYATDRLTEHRNYCWPDFDGTNHFIFCNLITLIMFTDTNFNDKLNYDCMFFSSVSNENLFKYFVMLADLWDFIHVAFLICRSFIPFSHSCTCYYSVSQYSLVYLSICLQYTAHLERQQNKKLWEKCIAAKLFEFILVTF